MKIKTAFSNEKAVFGLGGIVASLMVYAVHYKELLKRKSKKGGANHQCS